MAAATVAASRIAHPPGPDPVNEKVTFVFAGSFNSRLGGITTTFKDLVNCADTGNCDWQPWPAAEIVQIRQVLIPKLQASGLCFAVVSGSWQQVLSHRVLPTSRQTEAIYTTYAHRSAEAKTNYLCTSHD